MSVSRAADLFYTFKFIRTLTKKWVDMEAHALGIIDENGKVLRKAKTLKTPEEKAAYTTFHRLVFNLKRILEKLPFGKTAFASYAAALFLIKEETEMDEAQLQDMMDSLFDQLEVDKPDLQESVSADITPGVHRLKDAVLIPATFEDAPAGAKVTIAANAEPVGSVMNVPVYEATLGKSSTTIYVTKENLK